MRRFVAATLLAILISANVGCFVPIYDADPAVRARQLINTSEDLRALRTPVSYTHLTLPTKA